jgi:hypothetical protein
LQSKNDIPFVKAQVSIHQPTIKEIGYITEEKFYGGVTLLNFSKEKLLLDKDVLNGLSNFKIFMSIVNNPNVDKEEKQCLNLVLMLIFPKYKVNINELGILLVDENNQVHSINEDNFEDLKVIIREMFCLDVTTAENQDYNPGGDRSRAIAKKLKMGRAKVNASKGKEENHKISILSRYVSILSVGLRKDKNELLEYSVPQLFDEYNRFQLKEENDMYCQAKIAGAKGMKEVEHWEKDLYS